MRKIFISGFLAMTLTLTGCGSTTENKNNNNEIKEDQEVASTDQSLEEKSEANSTIMNETINDGPMAYDFKFEDLKGDSYKLSDLRGKKVYIKYWASWCPICMDNMEELDQMFAKKEDKDYELFTVVTPGQMGEKTKDDFIEWYESLGYKNIKVLLDENGQIIQDYGVRSAPTNILIGSDGVLMGVIPGQLDETTIDEVFTQFE